MNDFVISFRFGLIDVSLAKTYLLWLWMSLIFGKYKKIFSWHSKDKISFYIKSKYADMLPLIKILKTTFFFRKTSITFEPTVLFAWKFKYYFVLKVIHRLLWQKLLNKNDMTKKYFIGFNGTYVFIILLYFEHVNETFD